MSGESVHRFRVSGKVREVYFGPNFKSALLVNILRPNQKAIEKSIKFGDLSSTELERCTLHSG